jgi:hypothetical protein
MRRSRFKQAALTIAVSATITATIGVVTGALAASNNSDNKGSSTETFEVPAPPPGAKGFAVRTRGAEGPILQFRADGPGPIGGPPVHSEMIVPTKDGKDFETVTQDDGKVQSVSGDQLTITEGTEEATYKTVTLDIPSDSKVIRNGKEADLGDLQSGDQVHVSQAPEGSFVFATDGSFFKKMHHFRGRGLPPPAAFGGLPPGLPPAPRAHRGD